MTKERFICKACGQEVEYELTDDLYDVMFHHQAKCQGKVEARETRRIEDVLPPEAFRGNLITMDEILGEYVLITDVAWHDSSYKEDEKYLSLTIVKDGDERTLNTGAIRVVQVFEQLTLSQLPIYAYFEKIQLPNGRRVYRVKGK